MNPYRPPVNRPAAGANPNQAPVHRPPAATSAARRRPVLQINTPPRDPSRAVPLPLPPPAAAAAAALSANSPSSSDLERVRRLGSGAGGTVYLVQHRQTNALYALKVIYGLHDDSVRRQISREVQILRSSDNPNVVKCHGIFEEEGEVQLLLEYMDGGSLDRRRWKGTDLADVTRQILKGLAYLHGRKIVHRDIKPSNILTNSLQQVKIADFGVSRILSLSMDPCRSSVGTVAYMSPERIDTDLNQGIYDGYAGDIWSLGVTILECYLGKLPFKTNNEPADWASLMMAIRFAPSPEAPQDASHEFRDFINCCLSKDPTKRWTAARLLKHPYVAQAGGAHRAPSPRQAGPSSSSSVPRG